MFFLLTRKFTVIGLHWCSNSKQQYNWQVSPLNFDDTILFMNLIMFLATFLCRYLSNLQKLHKMDNLLFVREKNYDILLFLAIVLLSWNLAQFLKYLKSNFLAL